MSQLVKIDCRVLSTLVIVFVFFVLQVPKANVSTSGECCVEILPLTHPSAKRSIELLTFVPQTALTSQLRERAPKEYRSISGIVNPSQWLVNEKPRLT